ncbi:rhomboid family intramembrane serine protease [Haloferula sp. A504]|uniref:rhomboid family intramembrane serine protease n=1 Tax=Haloferula sp. A504 TaxID=3373601 RepID=UPI0031C8C293|nr:rhomboid family intramembrane serine protease [Verrucomicrobiaceae bacterium E54]
MSEPAPTDLPIWARPEAFPRAGEGWGWMDRKGRRHPSSSFEGLTSAIVDDAGARVDLVWTPDHTHLVLPEELPELHPALKEARIRWAEWEIEEGRRQMMIFGGFLVLLGLYSLTTGKPVLGFGPLGLGILLFLALGFFPWYQGRKRLRRARSWVEGELEPDLIGLRFETWLMRQKAPVTRGLIILFGVIGVIQWLAPGGIGETVARAGLVKEGGRPADWWRLATAPFLHGNLIHFLFNVSALAYLGRRMEVLVRWPHVPLVFVLAAWIGGEASAWFLPDKPSLGASGGLLGMLGFLLVFEWMHRPLVPESSRRRLLAGLLLTAAIGLVGFAFIDNGAHGGGVLAGMAYAFAVFPGSSSARRPTETGLDRVAGGIALGLIICSVAWTAWVLW